MGLTQEMAECMIWLEAASGQCDECGGSVNGFYEDAFIYCHAQDSTAFSRLTMFVI